MHILRGYPLEALALARRTPLFWVVSFALAALIAGLFFTTTIARTVFRANYAAMNMAESFGASPGMQSPNYFSIGFGNYVALFLIAFAFSAVVFVLRALTLKWVFSVRGAPQPFSVGAGIMATAYVGHIAVYAATFILLLIPGTLFPILVLFAAYFVIALLSLAAELIIYIGINRTVQFRKSPLIPHVLFTAVWLILVIVAWIVMAALLESVIL